LEKKRKTSNLVASLMKSIAMFLQTAALTKQAQRKNPNGCVSFQAWQNNQNADDASRWCDLSGGLVILPLFLPLFVICLVLLEIVRLSNENCQERKWTFVGVPCPKAFLPMADDNRQCSDGC
jgi:hypothetical protein